MRKWYHRHKNSDRSTSSNDALNLFRDEKLTSLALQNNWGPLDILIPGDPLPRALSHDCPFESKTQRAEISVGVLEKRARGSDILVEFLIRRIKIDVLVTAWSNTIRDCYIYSVSQKK